MKRFLIRWGEASGQVLIVSLIALLSLVLIMSIYIAVTRAESDVKYDSKGKRDPFIPLIGEDYILSEAGDLDISELILEGVVFDPENTSYVLLNGKTLEEGQVIGGFKVVRVFADGVLVKKGESQQTLRIKTLENE